ncbi:MAG: pentapeptide repeat-containing protein, partial [Clostridia bacterium]|nr:pentapeptide repeat-containing protein [Clostridia bacterium]
ISCSKELKSISSEEFEIMCAKHLLWLYDEGGEQADFTNCNLSDLDLTRRNLNNALFTGARLYGISLDDTQLCFADFTGADLRDCSLRGITADEIVMKNAVAYNCDFTDAVMMHGNFAGSDLTGSKFANTILQNACFDHAKTPKDLFARADEEHFSMNEQDWDESSGPVLSM